MIIELYEGYRKVIGNSLSIAILYKQRDWKFLQQDFCDDSLVWKLWLEHAILYYKIKFLKTKKT